MLSLVWKCLNSVLCHKVLLPGTRIYLKFPLLSFESWSCDWIIPKRCFLEGIQNGLFKPSVKSIFSLIYLQASLERAFWSMVELFFHLWVNTNRHHTATLLPPHLDGRGKTERNSKSKKMERLRTKLFNKRGRSLEEEQKKTKQCKWRIGTTHHLPRTDQWPASSEAIGGQPS